MFCSIISPLALAFADSAFKEEGIQRPEDLYTFEILHFRETLGTQWKPELLETPVFHQQVKGDISDSVPWTFSDFNNHIKRLSLLSGYPQDLISYMLRRGAADAIGCMFFWCEMITLANFVKAYK